MKIRAGLLVVFAALASLGTCLTASAQQLAFTFDDLPSHGNLPPGETRLGARKSAGYTLFQG
jgi:hypothetical protein